MIGDFNKSDKHMSECIQLTNESNMSFVAHRFFKMKTRIINPMVVIFNVNFVHDSKNVN